LVLHELAHGSDVVRRDQTVLPGERGGMAGVVDDRGAYRTRSSRHTAHEECVVCRTEGIEPADVSMPVEQVPVLGEVGVAAGPGEDRLLAAIDRLLCGLIRRPRHRLKIRLDELASGLVRVVETDGRTGVGVRQGDEDVLRLGVKGAQHAPTYPSL